MQEASTVSIAKMIEAHMEYDDKKFFAYTNLIAERCVNNGECKCAAVIHDAIFGKLKNEDNIKDELLRYIVGLIVSHVSRDEDSFVDNTNKIINRYERLGENRKVRIIQCRLDGSYKDMPQVVTLD